ncbi:MAG TPA: hypothetical protein VNS88_06830 [Nitrospiraceae bacterium]|nr:hypothetical protein [Nitrospiraceae bacterium]
MTHKMTRGTGYSKSSLEEWEAEWAPMISNESAPEKSRLIAIEVVVAIRTLIASGADPKEEIWCGFRIDEKNGTVELLEEHEL